MKRIHTTEINGWDETGERLYIYALNSDEEYWELQDLVDERNHDELLEVFGLYEHTGDCVAPGAMYYYYNFHLCGRHMVVEEQVGLNV